MSYAATGLPAKKFSNIAVANTTAPTFAGISSVTPNADGSITASWALATGSAATPVRYKVYIALGSGVSAASLFVVGNNVMDASSTQTFVRVFTLGNQTTLLVAGQAYTLGVRAFSAENIAETNTATLNATSQGVPSAQLNTLITQVIATQDVLQTSVNARPTNPLLTNDSRLNFLDIAISSRAAQTDMNTLLTRLSSGRATNLDNLDVLVSSRASQSSIANIQNNTSFAGTVPSALLLPTSGNKNYDFYVRLFNEVGSPVDADSQIVNVTIKDASGTVVVASSAMSRTALGQYSYSYLVTSADTERSLYVFFDYSVGSVAFNQVRTTEVQEFESKLDTLLSRLTGTRATNLDFLDVATSSRSSQSSQDVINGKIGAPVSTVSLDIAAVKSDTSGLRADYTTVRAARLDNLDVVLSTRSTQSSVTTAINQTTAAAIANAVWDELLASHTTSNSAGRTLSDLTGSTSPTTIADAVWDTVLSQHQQVGSTGKALNTATTAANPAAIANAVWDEQTTAHNYANTYGRILNVQLDTLATYNQAVALQAAINAIPTTTLLSSDVRLGRLDANISSRLDTVSFNQILGGSFSPSNDNLHAIKTAISAISAGDATAANQTAILNAIAATASATQANNILASVAGIPTNPLLADDARLNNLDATISSRATDNDMQLIKGSGFTSPGASLVAIKAALDAANLDLTPVLAKLAEIEGSSFSPTADALKPLNDTARSERANILQDTSALLATGVPFEG